MNVNTATFATASSDADVADYIALLKPRVMSLVIFTGLAGLIAAPGSIHPLLAFVAILCIAIASGAAGAINMWFDRDIDAIMTRTQNRPIPQGRVSPDNALAFGVILTGISVCLMGLVLNWVAAGLLLLASLFYVFTYTIWLKRLTPQNIVIGGAAGAFPPMIGWAAVTGDITLAPVILFMITFLWTPPHFWALALYRSEDYKRANVPMLPVTHGEANTKKQMLFYSVLLVPVALAPYFIGIAGLPYLLGAIVLNILFVLAAVRVYTDRDNKLNYRSAKQMFGYSIFYLFMIFTLLIIDRIGS